MNAGFTGSSGLRIGLDIRNVTAGYSCWFYVSTRLAIDVGFTDIDWLALTFGLTIMKRLAASIFGFTYLIRLALF